MAARSQTAAPRDNHARVLLHAFASFEAGGQQLRFVQLANAFGPRYRHLVTAMDGCYDAASRFGPGVNWTQIDLPVRRGAALGNRGTFRACLRQHRPSQLLSYNWGAIEWMAANAPGLVPQVHVEDGFRPDEVAGQLPRRVWTRRVLFRLSQARLLVPSQRLHKLASGWWVPAQSLCFVPNGVVIPEPPAARPPLPVGNERPLVVGTVASIRAEKNLTRLLRAVAVLRAHHALRLLVVGDGPDRATLERLADELDINDIIEFTGYMAQPAAALQRMDLFALSSDTEQLPIAMLEAMAHGLPVVATRVGDVPYVLPQQAHAALCEPDDAAFTATLAATLNARGQWAAWAQAGRDRVSQLYSHQRMLADWDTVFQGAWPGMPAA